MFTKNKILFFVLLFVLIMIILPKRNAFSDSVEAMAEEISAWLASQAPIQMDSSTYLIGAYSNGNNVVLLGEIDLNTTGSDKSVLVSNSSQIAKEVKSYSKNGLCNDNRFTPFIQNGGIVSYKYRFNDGSPFFSYEISSSDCY